MGTHNQQFPATTALRRQSIRTGEGRLTFAFRHFTSGNFLGAEFRVLPKERLAGGNDEIVDGGSKVGLVRFRRGCAQLCLVRGFTDGPLYFPCLGRLDS